ncbi:hypothetical protein ACXR2U_02200 [Jatrophihabitans sp. YIM 134969]
MTLRFSTEVEAADWLTRPAAVGNWLMPVNVDAFPAYGRLRYIPDPTRPDHAESWDEMPEDHPADLDQARRALTVLARFTGTPERCLFSVWEGYGGLPPAVGAGPMVEMPHRRHALVTGALADVADWPDLPGSASLPPALVWPADRSWLFTSDVDLHWAAIGCSEDALAALRADPGLDVVAADPTVPPPVYRG